MFNKEPRLSGFARLRKNPTWLHRLAKALIQRFSQNYTVTAKRLSDFAFAQANLFCSVHIWHKAVISCHGSFVLIKMHYYLSPTI